MGFRDPLPMDDFVQGNAFLTEAFYPGRRPLEPERDWNRDCVLFDQPSLRRAGPKTVSTGLALESWPSVVWDVNGYYHALGVGFRASRRQLREAYQARGGPEDERLTYVFSQLLDPGVRRIYDACPLGTRFIDRYVEEELKQAALRRAEQMREMGIDADAKDVLREWGFDLQDSSEDEGSEEVDIPQDSRDDDDVPPREPERWTYATYGWRLRTKELSLGGPEFLRRWQEAVTAACQRRGIWVSFGVGLMGAVEPGRVAISSVDGTKVVFVSVRHLDDDLTEIAEYAATQLAPVPG